MDISVTRTEWVNQQCLKIRFSQKCFFFQKNGIICYKKQKNAFLGIFYIIFAVVNQQCLKIRFAQKILHFIFALFLQLLTRSVRRQFRDLDKICLNVPHL